MVLDVRNWLLLQHEVLLLYLDGTPIQDVINQYSDEEQQLIVRLHLCNLEIWEYEDAARIAVKGVSRLVRERQEINRERNRLIEEFDRRFLPPTPTGEVITDTPGMLLDRLSILQIKQAWSLGDFAAQISDLTLGLVRMLDDIEAGRKQYKIYSNPKYYSDERP